MNNIYELKSNLRILTQYFEQEKNDEGKKIAESLLSTDASSRATALEQIKKLSASGNPDFQALLGAYHMLGFDNGKDIKHAIEVFETASDLGSKLAIGFLGFLWASDLGITSDRKKLQLLIKAADSGCALVQFGLGFLYLKGKYVEKNENKGLKLIESAAEQGHEISMMMTAESALENGNVKYGISLLEKLSQLENPEADYHLGREYIEGNAIHRNIPKGIALLENALKCEFEAAGSYLASLYEEGAEGIEIDLKKSFEVANTLAQQGNPHGQMWVGIKYATGKGIPVNLNQAKIWLEKATSQKYPDAFYYLGLYYLNHEINLSRAFQVLSDGAALGSTSCLFELKNLYNQNKKFFKEMFETLLQTFTKEAEEQNDGIALGNLGFMHCFILDKPNNDTIEYYKEASNLNLAWAAFHLGLIYEHGIGLQVNIKEAVSQYRKAEVMGCEEHSFRRKCYEIERLWDPLVTVLGDSLSSSAKEWTSSLDEIVAEYAYDREFYQNEYSKKEARDYLEKNCLFMFGSMNSADNKDVIDDTKKQKIQNDVLHLVGEYSSDPKDSLVDYKKVFQIS